MLLHNDPMTIEKAANTVDLAIDSVATEEKYTVTNVMDWIYDNICPCCNPLEWIQEKYHDKCHCVACCLGAFLDHSDYKTIPLPEHSQEEK
jgi:hypothetical protein